MLQELGEEYDPKQQATEEFIDNMNIYVLNNSLLYSIQIKSCRFYNIPAMMLAN